jgi:hypothetical protein
LSDLSHFEPVWEDMRKTHAHLAATINAMRTAGLIDMPPARGFRPGHGADLYQRIRVAVHGRPDRCSHPNAVPVELLTGEVVAALCPDCDEQLPAGFESSTGWWPGGMI